MPFDALYTPQTLGAVIQRTPDMPSFLKDKFFTNMKTFNTKSIAFDVKKAVVLLRHLLHLWQRHRWPVVPVLKP